MKKLASLLALLICISICCPLSSFLSENGEGYGTGGFSMPAYLISIGDEAFESTAAESVVLADSLVRIGQRAFAESRRMKTIVIPESVAYIGDQAFAGIDGLTVQGVEDSYASQWAKAHGISFAAVDSVPSWVKVLEKLLGGGLFASLGYICVFPKIILWRRRRIPDVWRSMRPQDRPELYPIDYRFP